MSNGPGNPSQIYDRSQTCTPLSESQTSDSARFKVSPTGDGFAVQYDGPKGWETLDVYPDQDVANEIVQIANSSLRTDGLSPDRDGGYGSHPRTAIPLSVLEAAVEDPSKSDLFAKARPLGAAPPENEYQALMETLPHREPAAVEDNDALRNAMAKALASLTDKQREAFLLHAEGMSLRDIAATLGLADKKSVQVRLANAKRALRDALGHFATGDFNAA